jgi:hypothetical protein
VARTNTALAPRGQAPLVPPPNLGRPATVRFRRGLGLLRGTGALDNRSIQSQCFSQISSLRHYGPSGNRPHVQCHVRLGKGDSGGYGIGSNPLKFRDISWGIAPFRPRNVHSGDGPPFPRSPIPSVPHSPSPLPAPQRCLLSTTPGLRRYTRRQFRPPPGIWSPKVRFEFDAPERPPNGGRCACTMQPSWLSPSIVRLVRPFLAAATKR